MKVLLDTNIVLDYLGANQRFTEDAEKVFDLATRRKDIKLVSSSAITDILYVLRRAVKDRKLVREKYESFRKKINILSVTEKDIDTAFARDWKDFEDAVHAGVDAGTGFVHTIEGTAANVSDVSMTLAGGQVQTQYTGPAECDEEWFWIVNGILDTTKTGLVEYDGGRFMIAAGRILREVNGLVMDPNKSVWYYLANGQVADYTGLVQFDGAWFYVISGRLATEYSGQMEYDGEWFTVLNGQVV